MNFNKGLYLNSKPLLIDALIGGVIGALILFLSAFLLFSVSFDSSAMLAITFGVPGGAVTAWILRLFLNYRSKK